MAPVKVPKKALKMDKPKEKMEKKLIPKMKKTKKNYESFSIYIFKVLRSIKKENMGISKKAMLILNDFVLDMLEKIAMEAGRLVVHGKKSTLSSLEIQTATSLLLPPEIAKHGNIEGLKALKLFLNSRAKDIAK